jgi:hypothetical protein
MPSSAALYNHDFVNLGPIDAGWAQPESCASAGRIGMAAKSTIGFPYLFETCDVPAYGECIPNGDKLDADYAERHNTFGLANAIYYHQPAASECPQGWEQAGIAAKDKEGKVSSSGIYAPTVTKPPKSNPTPNIFIEALNPGETAIVCCPSGFTANEGVGCHSIMPRSAYTADEVCSTSTNEGVRWETVTFNWNDKPVTGLQPTEAGTRVPEQVSRVTAAPFAETKYDVASYIAAITLVHGGGDDAPAPTTTSSKKEEEEPATKTSKAEETKTSTKEDKETKTPEFSTGKPESSTAAESSSEDKTSTPAESSKAKTSTTDSEETKTPEFSTGSPSTMTSVTTARPSGAPETTPAPEGGNGGSGSGEGEGETQPPAEGGSNGNGGSGNGEGENKPPAEGGSNGNGGNGDAPPEGAASTRWGNLSKTVTTVWGLAAFSGMLVAAL